MFGAFFLLAVVALLAMAALGTPLGLVVAVVVGIGYLIGWKTFGVLLAIGAAALAIPVGRELYERRKLER